MRHVCAAGRPIVASPSFALLVLALLAPAARGQCGCGPEPVGTFIPWEAARVPKEAFRDPDERDDYKKAVEQLLELFKDVFPRIHFDAEWDRPEANACAWRGFRRHVHVLGGLLDHKSIHLEGVALVLAHEVGHHYSKSKLKYPKGGMRCEDPSDYWATRVGLRKVYPNEEEYQRVTLAGIDQVESFLRSLRYKFDSYEYLAYWSLRRCAHAPIDCRLELFRAGYEKKRPPSCAEMMERLMADAKLEPLPDVKAMDQTCPGWRAPETRAETAWRAEEIVAMNAYADGPFLASSAAALEFADRIAGGQSGDRANAARVGAYLGALATADTVVLAGQAPSGVLAALVPGLVQDARYVGGAEHILADEAARVHFRVAGGMPTGHDFPDCVAVGWTLDGVLQWCSSGVLVAPDMVLTAGHCLVGTEEFPDGRVLVGASVTDPDARVVAVRTAQRHPDYEEDGPYDLAVLMLEEAIETAPAVRAATDLLLNHEVHWVRAVGFGTTGLDGRFRFGVRQMVTLPIVTKCPDNDAPRDCAPGLEFVTGSKGFDESSPRVDSGAALFIRQGEAWHLVGIMSRPAEPGSGAAFGAAAINTRLDVPPVTRWLHTVDGSRENP